MFFEFRLYKVVGGRMKDIHGRFRDKLPPLFARHGIRNIGCWTALSSPAGPTWVYLLAYTSLAERTHQWDSFYADQDWWKTRSETNDGEEMVERFDTHFLTPNPIFEIPRPDPASPGLDELRFVEIALGQTAAANALLRDVYLPKIVASGGRPRLVADALTGPSLPRVALLIRCRMRRSGPPPARPRNATRLFRASRKTSGLRSAGPSSAAQKPICYGRRSGSPQGFGTGPTSRREGTGTQRRDRYL